MEKKSGKLSSLALTSNLGRNNMSKQVSPNCEARGCDHDWNDLDFCNTCGDIRRDIQPGEREIEAKCSNKDCAYWGEKYGDCVLLNVSDKCQDYTKREIDEKTCEPSV